MPSQMRGIEPVELGRIADVDQHRERRSPAAVRGRPVDTAAASPRRSASA